jgi:putative flippase GtrA
LPEREEGAEMGGNHSFNVKYALVGLLGAAMGGLIVVVATKAVPRILCGMMAAMMENMGGQNGRGRS